MLLEKCTFLNKLLGETNKILFCRSIISNNLEPLNFNAKVRLFFYIYKIQMFEITICPEMDTLKLNTNISNKTKPKLLVFKFL